MKRIAIFCDGTWNSLSAPNATHVARLSRAVMPSAADGSTQLAYYQQGVGTGRGTNTIARKMDKWLGGALGWGLDDNMVEAYRNLVFWYEPGDEIYIFGFSRGAYTARSLGGLIRIAGIPPRDRLDHLKDAVVQYRKRDKDSGPDTEAGRRFRQEFSPTTATSMEDLKWRQSQGDTNSSFLRLAYMGVWDTVGALGLPGVFGAISKRVNKKYAFHDAALSRSVRSARHAVAVDERRRLYPPALWDNLDGSQGLNGEVTGVEQPYQQHWFPGVHSVIGGSGVVPQLSAFTAEWIAEGAQRLGLEFDTETLSEVTANKDHAADATPMVQKAGIGNLGGWWLADRAGPERTAHLARATHDRIAARDDYRPGSLSQVMDKL